MISTRSRSCTHCVLPWSCFPGFSSLRRRCIRLSRSLRAAPVASLRLFQSLGSRPAWPSIDLFLDDRILSSACTTFRPFGRRSPTALLLHQLSCTIDSLITSSTPLFTSIAGSSAPQHNLSHLSCKRVLDFVPSSHQHCVARLSSSFCSFRTIILSPDNS